MATWVYPSIPPDELKRKEEESLVSRPDGRSLSSFQQIDKLVLQARELQWLLESLQESLASLKEGLEECVALLAPREPGSTLVLSSLRSESVKGHVTRIGSTLRKCVSGPASVLAHSLPSVALQSQLCASSLRSDPEVLSVRSQNL